jgi:hypothetical protein
MQAARLEGGFQHRAWTDGRLVTARWPLDAMRYSQWLVETIEENLTG